MIVMIDDTIEVRKDEKFDYKIIGEFLKNKLPGTENPDNLTVRQFGGGAANLTYLLDYKTHQYVLRRPPLGPVAKSAHDMGREYKVLSVLHKSFPCAPQAFAYSDDKLIGTPFFIMERKKGVVIRTKFPSIYDGVQNAARDMSKALIDTLVDFHKVNYKDMGLADLGKPEGFISRQIEGWYKRWNASKLEENKDMNWVYDWLKNNQPEDTRHALIHNDYKLDNVMYGFNNPGKLVGVFDWDMCTLGDPLSDLGSLLTYWSSPTDPSYFKKAAMMPTDADLGFYTRSELVSRYAQKSGVSVDRINFYHSLGLFRLVVIIAQIYYRYMNKQTQDVRFAAFGKMIPLISHAARDVAENNFPE